jgi:hypothetical protein
MQIRQLEEDGGAGIAVFQMKEGEEAAMSDNNEVGISDGTCV